MESKLNISSLSDLELVSQFKQTNNNDFFVVLYQRYTHLVYGVCLKYLKNTDNSSDAVMDIFEKLMVDIKRHEVQNFKAWLYQVSKNHCLMHLRKKNQNIVDIDWAENKLSQSVEFDTHLHLTNNQQMQQEALLMDSLKQLSSEQKICVELFYIQNKSYQEISDQTHFTINQVKSYIQNGKRNLKLLLTKSSSSLSILLFCILIFE